MYVLNRDSYRNVLCLKLYNVKIIVNQVLLKDITLKKKLGSR